ncbi:MAG: tRNA dihydrouridine synthase DusB [Pseudomonadota bacterium]
MQIGPYDVGSLFLAPMAGVTDRPFRILCRELGADLTVSEMLTSDMRLWHTSKSQRRLDHRGEPGPRSVQIAGAEPQQMAEAARANADRGAQIIDINMGCPAKKVCNVAAGSALLRDESLVVRILDAVVAAVEIPVTLKIRTGWSPEHRNGVRIARLAEQAGVAALAVHGRTRACAFKGSAEYRTIAAIKQAVSIPVVANGDINTPEQAAQVLEQTGADALMLGRAAQGNPWIFRELRHYLATGDKVPVPDAEATREVILNHLERLYEHYGDYMGVRVARKHLSWYCKSRAGAKTYWKSVNRVEDPALQVALTEAYFRDAGHLSVAVAA